MQDGNATKINGDLLNFDKLRMMANRVKDIASMSSVPYEFPVNAALQNYLHKPPVEMSLSKLKEESHKCEPPVVTS